MYSYIVCFQKVCIDNIAAIWSHCCIGLSVSVRVKIETVVCRSVTVLVDGNWKNTCRSQQREVQDSADSVELSCKKKL